MTDKTKLNQLSKSVDTKHDSLKEYSILTNFPKIKNISVNKEILYCDPTQVILQSIIAY